MNWYNLSNFKLRRKDSCRKREIKYITNLQWISFFDSFSILVGRLLGPTDLLSFSYEIKLIISSELVDFKKNEFSLACWRNSSNDLFENLIFALVFFCYCIEVIIKNVGNFLRVCDCFIVLWQVDCFQDIIFLTLFQVLFILLNLFLKNSL